MYDWNFGVEASEPSWHWIMLGGVFNKNKSDHLVWAFTLKMLARTHTMECVCQTRVLFSYSSLLTQRRSPQRSESLTINHWVEAALAPHAHFQDNTYRGRKLSITGQPKSMPTYILACTVKCCNWYSLVRAIAEISYFKLTSERTSHAGQPPKLVLQFVCPCNIVLSYTPT